VSRALRTGEGRRLPILVGIGLIAAVTANTHVFFPLLAAPLSLALTLPRGAAEDSLVQRMRAGIPAAAALVLGALCSPYGLAWIRVFELNFRANALFGQSSMIAEHQPGFSSRLGVGVALGVLPLIASARWTPRERVVWGAMWIVGLVAFALKVKALLVWWFLAFPLAGLAATALLSTSSAYGVIPPLLAFAVPIAAALGFVVGVPPTIVSLERAWRAEQALAGSTLSSPAALTTDTLVAQLVARSHGTRVLTIFDLGSYLTWRAPGFSASIDGRTIFPDSAALPDTPLAPTTAEHPLGPWRSADAAIVPLAYPVASVLDTASGWQRIAESTVRSSPFGSVGLWLRGTRRDSSGDPSQQ
jgi:hypothetical protein